MMRTVCRTWGVVDDDRPQRTAFAQCIARKGATQQIGRS
jgi:hypothetical protein